MRIKLEITEVSYEKTFRSLLDMGKERLFQTGKPYAAVYFLKKLDGKEGDIIENILLKLSQQQKDQIFVDGLEISKEKWFPKVIEALEGHSIGKNIKCANIAAKQQEKIILLLEGIQIDYKGLLETGIGGNIGGIALRMMSHAKIESLALSVLKIPAVEKKITSMLAQAFEKAGIYICVNAITIDPQNQTITPNEMKKMNLEQLLEPVLDAVVEYIKEHL